MAGKLPFAFLMLPSAEPKLAGLPCSRSTSAAVIFMELGVNLVFALLLFFLEPSPTLGR